MSPRANWKGVLKAGDFSCPVALFTAASTSERIAFHVLNRKTGNRVHRVFVDSQTGKPVEAENQVKGYETGRGDYIEFEPDEIAAAVPESDKALAVQAFVACDAVDDVYFDRPYYLAPTTPGDIAAFDLLRDGLRAAKVAAIARAVLFRRVRSLLIWPHDQGLIATTLNFDYEIRSPDDAFGALSAGKSDKEMLDLALHIIKTKTGKFDPRKFDDRYEVAVQELVKAKLEGRKLTPPQRPAPTPASDLMAALRQSAGDGVSQGRASTKRSKGKAPSPRRNRAA